ncbi:endo alpha-1,4 polygalactosaminidase [Mycolicibacterium sp. CH28]|uniref:endo alpha-1,4 polygalactosaminidase n=1 Tax=Mycolicibacterium sp. CH28 TaxID=2512237 RepID=UPI0019122317|nr:endo alpha-1,4 polygalactosaminidase [Mycolicibacterium sp. CH28]
MSSCASAPTSPVTPAVGVRVDYQLGGSYPPDPGVEVVVRDRTAEPAAGLYNVCYLNAFQAQPGDAANWTINGQDLTLRDHDGHRVVDHDWDEALLDTSTATRRSAIAQVVNDWIDQCGHAGFRAVELDNLDSFTRSEGYLSPEDNLALARTLVSRAHQNGLAVAQKNAAEFAQRARDAGFDFAIAEECQHYDECDLYTNVYGPHVIEIEYGDQPAADFIAACDVNASRISVLRRDRGLAPKGAPGHLAQWCP